MSFTCYLCEKDCEGEPAAMVPGSYEAHPVCGDCADANISEHDYGQNYAQCHDCGDVYENDESHGEWVHVDDTNNKVFVCRHCINCSDHYVQCYECNDWFDIDHCDLTDTHNGYVCEECCEYRGYAACEDCGEVVDPDDQFTVGVGDYIICRHCYENGEYGSCDECGNIYPWDDLEAPDEDSDERYCCNCIDHHYPRNDRVLGWSEERHVELEPLDTLPLSYKYVGFELEYIDEACYGDYPSHSQKPEAIFRDLYDNCMLDMAKSTEDSTVSGEVVTAPMSLSYLYSDNGFYRVRKLCQIIMDNGCVAWDSKFHKDSEGRYFNCGGHIHVSHEFADSLEDNETFEDVAKCLAMFTNMSVGFWHRLSGRRAISSWAKFGTSFKHGDAINYTDNTYEFRFWQGTLNAYTMRARAVLCTNLVRYASRLVDPGNYFYGDEDNPPEVLVWGSMREFFGTFLPECDHGKDALDMVYKQLIKCDDSSLDKQSDEEHKFVGWFLKFYEEKYKENNNE